MGSGPSTNGFSPFDIYFQYVIEPEDLPANVTEAFDPKAVACYEAISVS